MLTLPEARDQEIPGENPVLSLLQPELDCSVHKPIERKFLKSFKGPR